MTNYWGACIMTGTGQPTKVTLPTLTASFTVALHQAKAICDEQNLKHPHYDCRVVRLLR